MIEATSEATDRTPPAILPLIVENLPLDDLAPYPHCVTWDLEWRKGKSGKPGDWTKVPKNPRTGRNAQSTNPATQGDAKYVLAHYDRFGYAVSDDDPFTFIDIDNGIDTAGQIKPWAQAIVDALPTAYWERSTTGTGLKGLVRGRILRNRIIKVHDGQVEFHSRGKFTVLTGHRLEGSSATIGEGQAALNALYAELCPEQAPAQPSAATVELSADDRTILARLRRMPNMWRLYDAGDLHAYDGNHSRGDQALCNALVSCGASREQADRLVRSSALMRDKWDEQRGEMTYGERTINTAFDGTVQPWDGWNQRWERQGGVLVPSTPTAIPDSQSLRFTPGPCADRVAALEAENAALRMALAERDQLIAHQATRIDTLKTVQLARNRILGNRSHGPSRVVAAVVASEIAWRATAGDTPPQEKDWQVPQGTMAISLGRIANLAGVSVNTASSHLQTLEDRGLIRKETKTVQVRAGDVKDPESGELYTEDSYLTQLFIGPAKITPINAQAAIDLSNTFADFSIQRTENRGGKRTPRCPDHPDAPVIREITDRCGIPSCKRVLNTDEYELPAMLLGAPEDAPAPPTTESQTLGDTRASVVDRFYRPQSLGFGQDPAPDPVPQRQPSGYTFIASGPPPLTGLQTPPGHCLDCDAKIPIGTFYCPEHGGATPLDHRTDVAYGARA
jgi:hypothetical protein